MEAGKKEYKFRPYVKDDIPFIQSSWGHSYYKSYFHTHRCYSIWFSPKQFHSFHRPLRERLLETRPSLAIIVCVSVEDETLILGWIAVEPPPDFPGMIIHYLYVKEAFKGLGIASSLMKRIVPHSGPVYMSHISDRAEKLLSMHSKYDRFIYLPHLI